MSKENQNEEVGTMIVKTVNLIKSILQQKLFLLLKISDLKKQKYFIIESSRFFNQRVDERLYKCLIILFKTI
jgi:hypothetical protein